VLEDVNILYKIASLYYESGNTQDEIANKVAMSRPMISRALEKARKLGIVTIVVQPPRSFKDLSQTISEKLGIREVVIAPSASTTGIDKRDRLNDVTESASRYLEREIKAGMSVGLGWGSTVYETVLRIRQFPEHNRFTPRIVPLMGSIGSTLAEYQESVIVNHAATRLGSRAYYYNVPMLTIRSEDELEQIRRAYSEIHNIWKNLDMAVFGLGAFTNIRNYPLNSFNEDEMAYLRRNHVIGDILARFFNEKGYIEPYGARFRYAGISQAALQHASNKVCIAVGAEKVPSIIAASRNGLLDTLITDYKTINEIHEALLKEVKT
jgi:DNA-binding transcriptional regulator LsrR (DeoR family)